MKRLLPILITFSPFAAMAQGNTEQQLIEARKQLEETRAEYTAMRTDLFRQINQLDDKAIELARELRELEREAELRTNRREALKREIEGRKAGFDYTTGILNQYADALLTRLHPAENQLYKSRIDDATAKAGAAGDDHQAELEQRLVGARAGIERLAAVIGGQRFEGEGLRNGSEAVRGRFLVLGPAVYMAAEDGKFEGVSTFTAGATALPTLVALKNTEDGTITRTVQSGEGEIPLDASMGKALEVEAAEESLMETIEAGGMVGHAILLLGAVAFGLTLFKVFEIVRFPIPSRRIINDILDDLIAKRLDEAKAKAASLPGMGGDLVRTGVERFYEKRRVLEEALFEKLVVIKPRLDRFLPFLGLTAAAAPLMGLLGTVLGIIKTFKAMALYGSGNQKAFTEGISEALITTAEGLIVAIPVLVLHGLMKSLARGKFSEAESVAMALMNGTTELPSSEERAVSDKDEGPDDDADLVIQPA